MAQIESADVSLLLRRLLNSVRERGLTDAVDGTGISVAAIIGIAAGGSVALGIALILIFRVVAKRREAKRKSVVDPDGLELERCKTAVDACHPDEKDKDRQKSQSGRRSLSIFARARDSKVLSKWIDEDGLHGPQLTKTPSNRSTRRISSLKGFDNRISWPMSSAGSVPFVTDFNTTATVPANDIFDVPGWPTRLDSRDMSQSFEDLSLLRRPPLVSQPLVRDRLYNRTSVSDNQLSSILAATRQREANRQALQRRASLLNQQISHAPQQLAPAPPFSQINTESREKLLDNDQTSYAGSVQSSVLDMFGEADSRASSPDRDDVSTKHESLILAPDALRSPSTTPMASPVHISDPSLGSPLPRRTKSVRFSSCGSPVPSPRGTERSFSGTPVRLNSQRSVSSGLYLPRSPRTPTSPRFTSEGSPFMVDSRRDGSLLALTEIDVFKSDSPKINTGSRSQTPTISENHSYPKKARKATFGSVLSDTDDHPLKAITGNEQSAPSSPGKNPDENSDKSPDKSWSPSPKKRKGYRREPLRIIPSLANSLYDVPEIIRQEATEASLCQSPTITQLNFNNIGVAIGEPSTVPAPSSPRPVSAATFRSVNRDSQNAYSPTMSMYNYYSVNTGTTENEPIPKRSSRRLAGDFTEETSAVKALSLFPPPPTHTGPINETSVFEVSDEEKTSEDSGHSPWMAGSPTTSPQRLNLLHPPTQQRLFGPRDMPMPPPVAMPPPPPPVQALPSPTFSQFGHPSNPSLHQSIGMLRRMNSDLSISAYSQTESSVAPSDAGISPTLPNLRGGGFNPNAPRNKGSKNYLAVGNGGRPDRTGRSQRQWQWQPAPQAPSPRVPLQTPSPQLTAFPHIPQVAPQPRRPPIYLARDSWQLSSGAGVMDRGHGPARGQVDGGDEAAGARPPTRHDNVPPIPSFSGQRRY